MRSFLGIIVLLSLSLNSAGLVLGVTFTPVKPAVCPAQTEVDWKYNLSNAGTGEWMVAGDPNASGNYISNVDYSIGLVGNIWISQLGLRVDAFATESGFDYLDLISTASSGWKLSGRPALGWVDASFPGQAFAGSDTFLHFRSDVNITDTGIVIGRARVCSTASAVGTGVRRMSPVTRYSGVLLGPNDVVYFSVPVGSQKNGETCSKAHDTFALWGALGPDLDLYVRCNALPTPTQFTYRSQSFDSQEFIHATTADCPCGGTWNIAVSQFSGGATYFNLVNHKHYATEHKGILPITLEPDITASQFPAYMTQMTRGLRHFFGANEGTRFWDSYRFADRTTGSGEIRIHGGNGRPNSDRCGNGCFLSDCNANLFTTWFDGPTMSHEMGHHYNCLWDEYEDNVGTECGHSIMGTQFSTNTNYCWCTSHDPGQNLCKQNFGDHGWDQTPPNVGRLQTGTAWENLQARSPVIINHTPDNYDYTQFDFNGIYAVPTILNNGNQ